MIPNTLCFCTSSMTSDVIVRGGRFGTDCTFSVVIDNLVYDFFPLL